LPEVFYSRQQVVSSEELEDNVMPVAELPHRRPVAETVHRDRAIGL
jgi:hypothetical protein